MKTHPWLGMAVVLVLLTGFQVLPAHGEAVHQAGRGQVGWTNGYICNTRTLSYMQSINEVGHMEDSDKIKKCMENLAASGKVGIQQERLAELLAAPAEVPTLLVVLSDADTFYEHLTNDRDFSHIEVTRTDGPVKEPDGSPGIVIATGKIPGDLAMVRLAWSLVEKMAEWPCVIRIEESATYHAENG